MTNVFAKFYPKAYPHMYACELTVDKLVGGTPTNKKVAEAWLAAKLQTDDQELIQRAAAEVMLERNIPLDEAIKFINIDRNLSGFRFDDVGLYFEGRCVKAAIKEAANIRWPKGRWGPTNKGTQGFFAEHVFVQEDRLYLNMTRDEFIKRAENEDGCGIMQSFVHTWRGNGISYKEYVENVKLRFTVATDFLFTDEEFGLLWLTGGQQGTGTSRSQGYGRYEVSSWEKL